MTRRRAILAGTVLAALCTAPAAASENLTFHFMQIEQVIGGVNGDTTAQAIQLRMRSPFQNEVSESRLNVFDATGQNPVLVIDIQENVPNGNTGSRVLIATESFLEKTDPTAEPDFIMTNPIPEDYFAAGRLTFEGDNGVIYFSFAWGGDAYTGPNDGSTFNDDDGDFGPPFVGSLPIGGVEAVRFQGDAGDESTTNENDFAFTKGAATFTNNNGDSFVVSGDTLPVLGIIDACSISLGSDPDGNGCDPANLAADDDVVERIRSQPGFFASEPNVGEIVMEGHVPGSETTMNSILSRDSGVLGLGLFAKVKARNYAENNTVQDVGTYDVASGNIGNDIEHVTDIGSADFLDGGGNFDVRLRYVSPAVLVASGFDVFLDQAQILVE